MASSRRSEPRELRLALADIAFKAQDENYADLKYLADVSLYANDEVRLYVGRLRKALSDIEAKARDALDLEQT